VKHITPILLLLTTLLTACDNDNTITDPIDEITLEEGSEDYIHWQTETVTLSANDFYITANGKTFVGETSSLGIDSDPGNQSYTTLELAWYEHDVQMRLYLYFSVVDEQWEVTEVRIYDGSSEPTWVYWQEGGYFKSNVGEGYSSDSFILEQGEYSISFTDLQLDVYFKQ
jgi:hypothetical protein